MGLLDSICSGISSAVSAVGTYLSGVGSALGGVLGSVCVLAGKLSPYLGIVTTVVDMVGKFLGIFKQEDKIEEMGAASVRAEKKPEDFDNMEEYFEYLRDEIKSGNVDVTPKNETEAAAFKGIGAGLGIEAMNEKYNLKASAEFWGDMSVKVQDSKLDEKEFASILGTAIKNDVQAEDISSYIKGENTESIKDKGAVSGTIKEALGDANPNLSKDEITDKFNELIKKD